LAKSAQAASAWQELPAGSCRTITFDRGTECAAYGLLADQVGTEAYFCDPHSPWQKGGIENANGRIRRFLPGERNLTELATDDLVSIVGTLTRHPGAVSAIALPKKPSRTS